MTGRVPGPNSGRVGLQNEEQGHPKSWDFFWEDMKNNPPRFFVDTSPANIHGYKNHSPQNYPRLRDFLFQNYKPYKTVNDVVIYKLKDQ